MKHVGVGATTSDRLCSTDPKRHGLLNMYRKYEEIYHEKAGNIKVNVLEAKKTESRYWFYCIHGLNAILK